VATATNGLMASQKADDRRVTSKAAARASPITQPKAQYHGQARKAQMTLLSPAAKIIQAASVFGPLRLFAGPEPTDKLARAWMPASSNAITRTPTDTSAHCAATTIWRCSPNPLMPRATSSPTFR